MPSYTAPLDDMLFLFDKLRDNKTPAEFLCECILKIKNDNKKVVSTIC